MTNPLGRAGLWLAAVLTTMLPSGGASADSIAEDKAKAGFIFNFTKYTEWPAATLPASTLLVCSLSGQALSGKLGALQGQQVQGRSIQVRTPTRPNEWRECQVLFITADEVERADNVLRNTAQHPVLTISDAPDFVRAGGIIGLKLRGGRIRFDINHGAARQAGLKLSSQLLKLADEVVQ